MFQVSRVLSIFFLIPFLYSCTVTQTQRPPGTNRLIDSQSPYLLQHAHNPVDWYPWGEEATAKALENQQLMIVSIGYAACHWCHVMEQESFEDSAVAHLMNENFVSIKVDREERPDVDAIFMDAALMTSGRTGWPLNAIALPDGRPIFAATYFPKEDWIKMLETFNELYQRDPQQVLNMAAQVGQGVSQMHYAELVNDAPAFSRGLVDSATTYLMSQADTEYGGLKGAPKFPLPVVQELMLTYGSLTQDQEMLDWVHLTLNNMRKGGLYDHLGGGFARYSVDSVWHVPHFEKMLYDNAMLVSLYSRAYRQRPDSQYQIVVRETLDFIQREMTDSLGGFYSSLDADSEGEEGNFYTWKEKDLFKAVGRRADAFKDYFNVSPLGNWQERREDKLNILHITDEPREVARRQGLTDQEFWNVIEVSKTLLRKERADRERPRLDDKQLTSWNGLMIEAYAEAYRTFGEEEYLEKAIQAAEFIQSELTTEEGGLYHSWRNGEAYIEGFASDYAFMIQAYLALYQATFDEEWLTRAAGLMDYTLEHFFDENTGMFYLNEQDDQLPITRPREMSDNVLPAANSALARDLYYLGQYLYQEDYLDRAEQMMRNIVRNVPEGGVATANWTLMLTHYAFPFYEVAVVGENALTVARELDQRFLPQVLLLGGKQEGELTLLQNKLVAGQTMIYVCQEKVCKQPTDEVQEALSQIE